MAQTMSYYCTRLRCSEAILNVPDSNIAMQENLSREVELEMIWDV
jgi:hypothetical protein